MDVPHCVINDYNLDTFKGVLKFSNEEIPSTFLPYEDETAALRMYKFLVKYANDDALLRCHQIVYHEKKWLLAFEDCLNVMEFFDKQKSNWERRRSQRSRASWFSYIRRDFVEIFQDAARIWVRKAGRSSCQSIYTENPIKCLFITRKGSERRVKVLPNLNGPKSKMNDDIEELKKLMDVIINYPFGSDKPDYDRFNLSPELRCFLHYLNSEFLEYVSPRCLLDSPFIWGDIGKIRIVRKLSEALPNLFIDLFDCCIKYACNLEDLHQPEMREALKRVFRKPLTSEYQD
ncbi:hypothetical protein CXB51_015288 [Gossypium anomalum]|uniref:Uncharacterized protein n=1 Tax=Gossypium anomalum TaxID=47600 RepID=A0A8J5Z5F5_9ROSI|nr:hypothetical protein CXB51_015288 [Gossypium anomalum]